MSISLSAETLISLSFAMMFMAMLPSLSVATVLARSATFGFKHGAITTLGIVLADVLFILLVIFGLMFIAESFNKVFIFFSYVGGVYLIWLSWQSRTKALPNPSKTLGKQARLRDSFNLGFLLTLADQKAVFFYLAFFPAFLNLKSLTHLDGIVIVLLAMFSVGLPKIIYATFADRIGSVLKPSNQQKINHLTSILLFVIGVYLIIKTSINL